MPAEHLRALINELHPGVSVQKLSIDAGLGLNKIAYWLRPTTKIDGIPSSDTIKDIARALRCDPELVVEAFAADAGIPLPRAARPDPDEEYLLGLYRRAPSGHRAAITEALADRGIQEMLLRYLRMTRVDQVAMEQVARGLSGHVALDEPGGPTDR